MFGNQGDQPSQQTSNDIPDESIHGVLNDGSGDDASAQIPATDPGGHLVANPDPASAPATDQPADQAWQHPGLPIDSPSEPISDIIAPSNGASSMPPGDHSTPITPIPGPPNLTPASDTNVPSTDDLVDIKQKALAALSPLVDHLDQTPEDRFRTTMMMIQASDDQSLIKDAYSAAHAIEDEKVRAQALLDIVNEINYFTQHQQS